MKKVFNKFQVFANKPIDFKAIFKKFLVFANEPIKLEDFRLSVLASLIALSSWALSEKGTDKPTFFLTLLAFVAAAVAIWQQHKAGKTQEIAGIKQEIIGAWQILANQASGNSGKIEAIEFLAKNKKSLSGINMSFDHHKGQVYLAGLDVSQTTLGHQADLFEAHFEGANLREARFEGANLVGAHFEGADLIGAHFEGVNDEKIWSSVLGARFKGANLSWAHFDEANLKGFDFEGADLIGARFEGANLSEANFAGANLSRANFEGAKYPTNSLFKDSYVLTYNNATVNLSDLPHALPDRFKFQFEFEFDTTKESEPELNKEGETTGNMKHFIKLIYKPSALNNKTSNQ